ncbi:hypothetical protein CHRY9390_01842 [Chryseobacterium aquaeductus]|uniref:Putative auto-transporter adhesin head GIN domain-containing protein n=1 Tax=Chryseobacterium aquaeductus TaxID=2675056 RepID=A0A9N8MGS0_9FLAO|nr:DUF4252 domain-containing protein [Chryseobacterium aquaeductus]CAA7331155.1 hypothetical protein CHRY9390_01842 [Chryseobacterium potabilaquae]CAD7808508.1 hypothetical protein CHRY9390_01842 [Chryseobacterium aquaeductus]
MKKIFIIFALAFSHFFNVYGQKEKLDQLFDKYQEVEGVTSIKIAKPMFGMLSNLNIGDSELDQIKPLLSKINGLKVLITESSENGKSSNNLNQLNKEITSYLKNMNYSEMMSVKNGESKIKFLSSEAKNGILEDILLRIDSGNGENILVMLDGKLSMDDVNKIINSSETANTSSSTTTVRNSFNSDENSSYLNGENRNVGEFSGIEVSTGVNVVFKQENSTSVKVLADSDKLQYVITKVENGVLKVYIDNKGSKRLKFKNLSVNISSPKMDNIKTSSGSNFTVVNSIKENNLQIEASSGSSIAGKFTVNNIADFSVSSGSNVKANITSGKIMLKSSSGSNISVEGNADIGIIDVSSGSVCKAENLRVNNADVESTSGSSATIHAIEKLRAKASSGGSVRYRGNPTIDSDVSKTSGGSLSSIN